MSLMGRQRYDRLGRIQAARGRPRPQIAAQADELAARALTKIEDPRHSELRQLRSKGKSHQWLAKGQALQLRAVRK